MIPKKQPRSKAPKKGRLRTYLREWRIKKNKTQEQIAEVLGISAVQVGRIENGERQYMQWHLEVLADYYETDPASLIMRDPTDPEAIWSIWDKVPSADKPHALEILSTYANKRRA